MKKSKERRQKYTSEETSVVTHGYQEPSVWGPVFRIGYTDVRMLVGTRSPVCVSVKDNGSSAFEFHRKITGWNFPVCLYGTECQLAGFQPLTEGAIVLGDNFLMS